MIQMTMRDEQERGGWAGGVSARERPPRRIYLHTLFCLSDSSANLLLPPYYFKDWVSSCENIAPVTNANVS